jgi:hypothetical protein
MDMEQSQQLRVDLHCRTCQRLNGIVDIAWIRPAEGRHSA